MSIVTTQPVNQPSDLTSQLTEVLKYFAGLEKDFVNKTVTDSFSKFEEKLGTTSTELQNLVKSLDGLDFKEDGKIDPTVITGKVATLEASVKTLKDQISSMESTTDNTSSEDVKKLQAQINSMKIDVDDIKTKVLAKITDRVSTLEGNVTNLTDRVDALELDVKKIKADLDSSAF